MSATGFRYDRYRAGSADGWMLRIGEAEAPPILFLPPLFEEMNRTRGLLADIMRRAAARGHGCWLPDLPGTGESERALDAFAWVEWADAVKAAAAEIGERSGKPPAVASLRGGALLDQAATASCHWRFSPVDGASLARDLGRTGLGGGGGNAGYAPSESLLASLRAAVPAPVPGLRILRLASDPREADEKIEGPALWRRSEPGKSPELADLAASDLLSWVAQCAAS